MSNYQNPYAFGLKMTANTLETVKEMYKTPVEETEFVEFEKGSKTYETAVISERDVEKFAYLSGDHNRLHTDTFYAEESGPFNGPIAHGVLVMGSVSSALADYEGDIIINSMDDLDFVNPVHIGDEISVECEIIELDGRKAEVEIEVTNTETDEMILTGSASIFNAEGMDLE